MRLFVALDIPEDVRAAIHALMAKLRPACRNARWVRIEGLHVTLKFIGETSSEKAAADQDGAGVDSFARSHPHEFSRPWIFSK